MGGGSVFLESLIKHEDVAPAPGPELSAPSVGAAGDFVFSVRTKKGICRHDRDISRYYLRRQAKALGIYWVGFGLPGSDHGHLGDCRRGPGDEYRRARQI